MWDITEVIVKKGREEYSKVDHEKGVGETNWKFYSLSERF